MTSAWTISENPMGILYGVYRLKNSALPDRSNNRDVYGQFFRTRKDAERICQHLNRITADVEKMAHGAIPKTSVRFYKANLRRRWRDNPHMIEAIDTISQKYI